MDRFQLRIDDDGVVCLSGELDMAAPADVAEVAASALDGERRLVLDLSHLTFIDSSGVRVILRTASLIDGELLLRGPQPAVRRVLDVTGVVGRTGIRLSQ